jgi:E3 ubiquitin-protein ligase synoviolin
MVFFILILTFYGLPLNIIRDVYITARSFYQRCRDLARYLDATKNMDQRYPDATQADLNEMSDKTCIICREELVQQNESAPEGHEGHQQNQGPNMSPKKLSCGHIFHFHCLRSWLERQQSCPTWSVGLSWKPCSGSLILRSRRSVLETGDATQARPAQPVAQPNNNGAAPGAVANRDAPAATPTPTTNNNAASSSERSPQRSRRHRWANELPGFQAGPLKPPLRFEGFNVGPGDWQPWGPLSSPKRPRMENEEAEPSSEPSSSGGEPGEQPSTNPRDNAASAALRRLGSGNGLGVVESGLERQAPSSSSNRPSINGHTLDKGKAPMRPLSEQRLASLSRAQELGIPPMIPLFDPSLQLASDTNSSHQPTPTMSPSSTPMLSREVIDERLRSLNNIQDTLMKSAEELLKLKSLLPSSSPSVEQSLAASASDIQQPTPSTSVELDRATESESYPSEDD